MASRFPEGTRVIGKNEEGEGEDVSWKMASLADTTENPW